ncbi:DUF1553 domain-containing protein [Fimbriiglobus ruber]|uniref:Cytochrome C n=1 Tax=Fimbriiglobus ruber TaxID=1908690 RepID=A0A225EAY7_9BACT|nr:DUF1553 domain-containing protein [Fimbriiglobus ruber]OWK46549.1 cytochrome C [Fimbriiglobus ruber]
MIRSRTAAVLFLLFASHAAAADPPVNKPDFDRDVAPLLAQHCLGCHSGAKPRGDLDLSHKTSAFADDVIVPGKLAAGKLWQQIAADKMPPKKPLPAADRATLRKWIESGAAWGTDPVDPLRYTTTTRAGTDWWSLKPIQRPTAPANSTWGRNPIDALVLAKMKKSGLTPSPEADRRTLARRLYFDLTGLPPSAEEIEAFAKDKAPDAYEKLVDKLLASPHYGERWARHWLDVVRFGETHGFERNEERPTAWHYRDWVIRALNADLPYDEFARLQLAGDVLHPDDPDAVKASGYLVAGVHNTVLGTLEIARQAARQDEIEDLVGNIGQTFVGLTAQCARCHDHKFDPISSRDYYRLAASISGVTHGERTLPNAAAKELVAKAEAEVSRLTQALDDLEQPVRRAILAERIKGAGADQLPLAPSPVAAWDFRGQGGMRETGPKMTLAGAAAYTPAGLKLDGKTAVARSTPLPHDLREKTLEAWVRLDNLNQRGGAAISLETPDGLTFDAIVFGEQEPRRWMAGSNFFLRTSSFKGDNEPDADHEPVHLAMTYAVDGTITGYRSGKPYGVSYKSSGPQVFKAGQYIVTLGLRHDPFDAKKLLAGTILAARVYDRALTAKEVAASAAGRSHVTEDDLTAALSAEKRAERTRLRAALTAATAAVDRAKAEAGKKIYATVPMQPPITRVLVRGQVTEPAETVRPGALAALTHVSSDFGLVENAPEAERRVKLAAWVTDRANPLFARVIVNRLWHHHFGTGIVETPNDFGFNGGKPSHPELLDWLASELVARDYHLKAMHRLIVTSAAYRQSSAPRKECLAIDADSRLVWRKKPQRLEAEAIRDAMLATAGLLNRTVGGRGFNDYRVSGGAGTIYYDPEDPVGPEFHRRSIYRFVPRGGNPGLLEAFDCPDPAGSAPRRASTTTPLQALALWNGPFALRMAGAFAARVTSDVPDGIDNQVGRAYQIAFQREPDADETAAARALVEKHGLRALCRALLNANEFVIVE